MKHFLLFMVCGLIACKVNDKARKTTSKPEQLIKADSVPEAYTRQLRTLSPDECLLEAFILSQDSANGKYLYRMKVKKIHQKGFGFSQNLKKNDVFEASGIQKLNDTTSVIIAIEYVFSLENGHYRIESIEEN